VNACRKAKPEHYIKVNAYNANYGKQTLGLSFFVQRPTEEPGFRLERQESHDRAIRYTLHSYATDAPPGRRYNGQQ
ncbi:MAG: ribulose bisphosphate carboxylase small subunit, partial [Pseudonocardiaceae bacterium]